MSESQNLPAVSHVGSSGADSQLAGLSGARTTMYASYDTSTKEGKIALYQATSDAEQLADHLGETINLTGFVAQIVELTDENTGETSETIRTIITDDKGNNYAAVSKGILTSLRNLVGVFGDPSSWDAPLPIQVVEERGRNGFRFMTVKLATGK